jgi:hypothetical protein
MKKLIAVPVVAVVAAVAAASAAGFAGGVSAGPLQTGDANDLECAHSAKIVEYGYNDHTANPYVDNVRVRLDGAQCEGQAVHVIALTPGGTQDGDKRGAAKVADQPHGTQYVRIPVNNWDAEDLKSVRISIDPGYAGMPVGSAS